MEGVRTSHGEGVPSEREWSCGKVTARNVIDDMTGTGRDICWCGAQLANDELALVNARKHIDGSLRMHACLATT